MRARARTLLTAAALAVAVAADARPQTSSALELLDVPYLPQSEALCGGAAAAMVMRYWGATGVYAGSFAALVADEAGGIRGEDLLRELQERGWDARSFRGDVGLVRTQLARRRPIVALIEDRPGRFHYVVVVGWSNGHVVLHDPARAPFRIVDEAEFSRAWAAAGSWTMLVLPGDRVPPPETGLPPLPPEKTRSPVRQAPCNEIVNEGVRLAGAGDPAAANRAFELAAAACPGASAPWREMAGLHALGGSWSDAARDARHAVALDPSDRHAWRILATARYLTGDPDGALDAWNRIGEPRVDLVDIKGLGRTRYAVIAGSVAIKPETLLTTAALARARRRLADVPSVQASRVAYRPAENGRARVDIAVFERPALPVSTVPLIAMGVRMASEREMALAVSSPSGGGEVWVSAWRWWAERPRVTLGFSAPLSAGGVLRIEAFDERQAYGTVASAVSERRRAAAATFTDWMRSDTRWDVSVGLDRWRTRGRAASVGAGLERHLAHDTVVVTTRGAAWFGSVSTWMASMNADWRSSRRHEGTVWSARAGVDLAGEQAPFALWPGAGTGPRADVLLRAHPVLDGGHVVDAVLGRKLLHAGAEWRHWLQPIRRVARVGPAIFLDAARAADGASFSERRSQVDLGAGVRVVLPGAGVVGIDVARGLRDGKIALSIGWRR